MPDLMFRDFTREAETPYENGVKAGLLFSREIREKCARLAEKAAESDVSAALSAVERMAESAWPEALGELNGRADGAKADRRLYLLYVCNELWDGASGCTDVIARRGNRALMAHNEDDDYSFGNFAFVRQKGGKGGPVCYMATADSLMGVSVHWSDRLVTTMNYIRAPEWRRGGVPSAFLLWDLVRSENVEEMREKCRNVCCMGAFNLNILESATGKTYSLECMYDRVSLVETGALYCHTNHLLHSGECDRLSREARGEGSNSLSRLETARAMLEAKAPGKTDENDILRILMYRKTDYSDSILADEPQNRTAVTFFHDSAEPGRFQIYSHLNRTLYRVKRDLAVESKTPFSTGCEREYL